MSRYEQFQAFRSRLNCRILGDDEARGGRPGGTLTTKRFFTLDARAYEPGALDAKTKELLGLVASLVLRCDDCVAYHIDRSVRAGCADEELWETFDIGLIVGGSIVIPHLRRAVEFLDACRDAMAAGEGGDAAGTGLCGRHAGPPGSPGPAGAPPERT